MLPVFNSFTISTFSILSKENSIAITTTSLPGIMLIQHPAVLSENMVSLYFFLLPQRCRISHRRQCASLLHWNLTIPPSLWPDRELRKYHCPCQAFNTAAGCNPAFASAKPLSPRWASWRAVEGSTKQECTWRMSIQFSRDIRTFVLTK